jgi:hypothetical protein
MDPEKPDNAAISGGRMSVPQIVEKDQSPKRQRFLGPRVPPNLFAMALGIAGLAQAWHAAVPLLGTPQAIPDALNILDAALWLVLVGAYLAQARGSSWPISATLFRRRSFRLPPSRRCSWPPRWPKTPLPPGACW